MNRIAVKFTRFTNFIKSACISISMLAGIAVAAHGAELPKVSITPSNSTIPSIIDDTAYVREGDPVGFFLQTISWLDREITVNVRIEDSGGYLAGNYHQEVIPVKIKPYDGVHVLAGYSVNLGILERKVRFMTNFDNVPEEDNIITFTLLDGEGYEVNENKKVAKTFVLDDDNNFVSGDSVDVSFVASPDNETVQAGEKVSIYATTSHDALLGIKISILKQNGEEKVYHRKRRVSRIIGNNRITRWSPSFTRSYLQPDNTYYDFSYRNDASFTIKVTSINGTEVDGEELVLEVGKLPRTVAAEQVAEGQIDTLAFKSETEDENGAAEDITTVFPTISVAAESDVVAEGEVVRFLFSADPAPTERLEISTQRAKEGNFFETDLEEMSVIFEPHETETTLSYNTVNDELDESDGSVSVTILEVEDSYVVGENSSVRVVIADNDEVVGEIVDASSKVAPSKSSEDTVAATSVTDEPEKDANDNLENEFPTFSVFATSESIKSGDVPAFYIVTDKMDFRDVIFQLSYELDTGETVVFEHYDGDVPEDFTLTLSQFPGKYVSKESPIFAHKPEEEGRVQKYHLEIVDRKYYNVDLSAKKATVAVDFQVAEDTQSPTVRTEIKFSTDMESDEPLQSGEYVRVNLVASAKPTGPVYVRYAFTNAGEEIFADKSNLSPEAFVQNPNFGYGVFVAEFKWSPEHDVKRLLRGRNPLGSLAAKVELIEDSKDPSKRSYTVAEKNTVTFGVLPPPEVTITAKTKVITEGSNAVFALTANRRDHNGFNVNFTILQDGDFIADPNVNVVRFAAGSVEETLKVHTTGGKSGDRTQTFAVYLMPGNGYMEHEKIWSAGVEVLEAKKLSATAKTQMKSSEHKIAIPLVSVRAKKRKITEGEDAVFLIESDAPVQERLKVNLAVKAEGDYLKNPLPKKVSVKIPAGKRVGKLVIATENDREFEVKDGIIKVSILSGADYATHNKSPNNGKTVASTAKIVVLDNDEELRAQQRRNAKLHRSLMPSIQKSSMGHAQYVLGRRFGMAFSEAERNHSIRISSSDSLTAAIENGGRLVNSNSLRLKNVLDDSSFALRITPEVNGSRATIWGNTFNLDNQGRDDQSVWNGDTFTSHFGVDSRIGKNLLIGATTYSTESSMAFEHEGGPGIYNVDINSIQPYAAWSDGASQLNGFAGYGFGEIEINHADASESETVESKLYSASVNGRRSLYEYDNALGTGEFNAEGKAWTTMQLIQGYDSVFTQGYEVQLNGANAKSFDNGLSLETTASIGLQEQSFNLEAMWDFQIDSLLISPSYNAEWSETGLNEYRFGSRVSIGRDANTEFGLAYDREGNPRFDINGQIQW